MGSERTLSIVKSFLQFANAKERRKTSSGLI